MVTSCPWVASGCSPARRRRRRRDGRRPRRRPLRTERPDGGAGPRRGHAAPGHPPRCRDRGRPGLRPGPRRHRDRGGLPGVPAGRLHAARRRRKSDVLAGLRGGAIWHLACHGAAVPDRPLESRLELADGSLTVREILARPSGRHRLAMLSAASPPCGRRPARRGAGFPGALLQSGVRAVVASGWRVQDAAAYAFSLAFHDSGADMPIRRPRSPPPLASYAEPPTRSCTAGSATASARRRAHRSGRWPPGGPGARSPIPGTGPRSASPVPEPRPTPPAQEDE